METLQHDLTNLQYDVPIEVTQKQYLVAIKYCEGLVCHKIENGKYYIKPWLELKYVSKLLSQVI